MDADDQKSFLLQTLVLTIWLGMYGTQIELEPLKKKFKTPKGIILGLALQTIFLPAWTSLLIAIMGSRGSVALAFLIVACSPGGVNSNIWCLMTQSDLALSVAMTTVSTFVCAGMMPLNLYLYGQLIDGTTASIPMVQVLVPAASVIIGTGCGIYLRHRTTWTKKTLKRIARAAMIAGLVIIVFAVVIIFTDGETDIRLKTSDYFMAIFMNGTTLVGGALVGRFVGLEKPEAVSIGYEVSTQNLSIPLFIFYNSYSEEETANMTAILILFGLTSVLLNGVYMYVVIKFGWTNYTDVSDQEQGLIRTLSWVRTDDDMGSQMEWDDGVISELMVEEL